MDNDSPAPTATDQLANEADIATQLTSGIPPKRSYPLQAPIRSRRSQELMIDERLTVVLVHEGRQQLCVVSLRVISE